jgi:hypothetical protein
MIIMAFLKPKSIKPYLVLRETTQVLPMTLDLSYSHILIYHNLSHLNPFIFKPRRERVHIHASVILILWDRTLGYNPEAQKKGITT